MSPPTRGRWSTEPPPRTVCHPPDGFGACARRALVSSRFGLGLFQPVDQPVRPSRADGGFSFASLNPSSVHRRVSPLGRSVGHRSLPDSPVPPRRRRVSRPRAVHSMSRGRDRIRDDTGVSIYTTSRPR